MRKIDFRTARARLRGHRGLLAPLTAEERKALFACDQVEAAGIPDSAPCDRSPEGEDAVGG